MAVTVNFVCLYSSQTPNIVHFILTSYLECLINFSGTQQYLAINNFVFLIFYCTTIDLQKIDITIKNILAEKKLFLRKPKKKKNKNELKKKLEVQD